MTDIASLKVAVFGAGSIGCYLGGLLAAAGAQVSFIGRKRFQQDLQANGLTLSHYQNADIIVAPDQFEFCLSAQDAALADIVLVCVKSDDTQDAAETLRPLVSDSAVIISFQNGVSNPEILRRTLPASTILGAVVPFNVVNHGDGHFHCGTEGDLIVEASDHPTAQAGLSQIQAAFAASGQACRLVDNITAVQWGKLLVNLNNALNTLYGGPLKSGLMQRDYRRTLAVMIEEGIAVLAHAGITPAAFGKASPGKMLKVLRLPNWIYKRIMNRILKMDEAARSSMLDDLDAGRQPEIKYLQGEIVALAAQTGNTAPVNQAVMDRVHQAFKDGASPQLSGAALLTLVKDAQAQN